MDYPRFRDLNIDQSFQKLKEHVFINYKGALIMRGTKPGTSKEGFYWKDDWYEDLESAKSVIDETITMLSNTVNISMTVTRGDTDVEVGRQHIERFFTGGSAYDSFKKSQP